MAQNYLIAIGGTGSRCVEAVVYLAAAGLFQSPIHMPIIDPDQNKGNSVKARQIITDYHALHLAQQPAQAQLKTWTGLGGTKLPGAKLFRAAIHHQSGPGSGQYPIFWHNPNSAQRRFGEVIEYQAQRKELKDFLNLFYEPTDLEMVLDVGYRGRTNVGAVALKQDLEGTAPIANSGLREFLTNLNIDLQGEEARVFVMGSVFGGTGAAGLPTVPALIKQLPGKVISHDNRKRLRYGCAMMTPYFSFPKGNNSSTGPGTDSARHAVATQAALLHYAHVPPGYQHVYFIGAPARPQTNSANVVGGQNQANAPHYAEMVAALAAWEFFGLAQVRPDARELHFADTKQSDPDLGVRWDTLPVHPSSAQQVPVAGNQNSRFTLSPYSAIKGLPPAPGAGESSLFLRGRRDVIICYHAPVGLSGSKLVNAFDQELVNEPLKIYDGRWINANQPLPLPLNFLPPHIRVIDDPVALFEDSLIQVALPANPDAVYFLKVGDEKSSKTYLYPFKPEILSYFSPAEVAELTKIVQVPQSNSLRVELSLPLENNRTVKAWRDYPLDQAVIVNPPTARLAAWPDFTSSTWNRYFYFKSAATRGGRELDFEPLAESTPRKQGAITWYVSAKPRWLASYSPCGMAKLIPMSSVQHVVSCGDSPTKCRWIATD